MTAASTRHPCWYGSHHVGFQRTGRLNVHYFSVATGKPLEPPDGDATQADTGIMRVARQAPTAVTGRLVEELKAEGEKEREYEFNKGLAVAKQLKVGRFIVEIDGNGPIFAGLASCVSHGSPSG